MSFVPAPTIPLQSRFEPKCEGRDAQRAGIALPHAAGDGLSGVTGDDGLSGATGAVTFPDGMPVPRAMNPWATPEAST